MRFAKLGSSGLRIAPISLGCMSYGPPGSQIDWSLPEEEALPVLNHCHESGLKFLTQRTPTHTAARKSASALSSRPRSSSRSVATGTNPCAADERNGGYLNQWALSRKHIFDSVDASLRRLDLEYIDLLQIHRFDPGTPVQETMEALHDVVKAGKVRYIGASSMWAHQILEMHYTARMRGWTEFISMQNLYTPTYREEEREMILACLKLGMGGLPWSPLMGGFLARPWRSYEDTERAQSVNKTFLGHSFTEADRRINEKIEAIASQPGVSMATVTIAWCLSKPFVVAPMLGLSNTQRVDEAIRAMDFDLSEEEIKSIELYYEPQAVIGHE